MKKPQLLAFMNAYSQGKSGGDMVFIEVVKRMHEYEKTIVTSKLGRKLCLDYGITGNFIITSNEEKFINVTLTYIKRTIKALLLFSKLQNYSLLLGTSDFLPDVLPLFLISGKNKQSKWIQHIFHVIPQNRHIVHAQQKISFVLIKSRADLIIVDNALLKRELLQLGFHKKRIIVNHPGINLSFLSKVTSSNRNHFDALFMAQLRKQKGIFDLIKIWALVVKEIPNATLGIIGKGDSQITEELKINIATLNLEKNITLLGFLDDQTAYETIKASKLFIFPSHEEGFGIAPLEAQALEVPVVAWDLPVFSKIFPKGMIRIPIGKLEQFASKVIHLLSN